MARVIYTGPLNPVIFARAKKEAEKAERIKGYKPRIIKTPANTVIYNTSGSEVKAIVSDDMAPITFSSERSAIPVAPNFLHLHPDLPEKVYGRPNYATASGYTKNCGIGLNDRYPWGVLDYIGAPFLEWRANLGGQGNVDAARRSRQHYREITHSVNNLVALSTNSYTPYSGMTSYWPSGNGGFPDGIITTVSPPVGSDGNSEVNNTGNISIVVTKYHAIVSNLFGCTYANKKYYTPSPPYYGYGGEFQKYGYAYSSAASGVFLTSDIRVAAQNSFSDTSITSGAGSSVVTSLSLDREIQRVGTNVTDGGYYNSSTTRAVDSLAVDYDRSVTSADGGVLFAVTRSEIYLHGGSVTTITPTTFAGSYGFSTIDHTEQEIFNYNIVAGVVKNLSSNILGGRLVLNDRVSRMFTAAEGLADNTINAKALLEKRVYVSGSVTGFEGAHIFAKVYNSITGLGPSGNVGDPREERKSVERTQYEEGSVFSLSHLAYYFDIFRGQYTGNDDPQWAPPEITTDGICLPHAWWFVRGNETRETHFYANNHNRLTVVIYPQGRHEFSVDEAEIVSVELDYTPQFVIKPGSQFAFGLTSFTTKTGPFPYAVEGLVEELDEDGEKTGFYLAQDGVVLGEFSATHTTAEFTLSPRQPTDASRLVVMAVTTDRATPVVAHVEVFGQGPRAVMPMAVSIECTTPEILAGQAASFYVTCTSVANNSQLPYTVKRGGSVVKNGFFNVSNNASWSTYGPPVVSRSISEGGAVQYVVCDASTTGTAQQSTAYEITAGPEGNQATASFVVVSASERYARPSDRPPAIDFSDLPPMFFLQSFYKRDFGEGIIQYAAANVQHTLINRIYYSLKKKRVYALFWDGQSCDVTDLIRLNPGTGAYEPNPDWKEVPFDYPPAVDPYGTPGALEPYVYAYLEYERNRTGA